MIHTLRGVSDQRRRIGVIQIPRAQRSRLGTIRSEEWISGPNTTSLSTLTPVSDLMPVMLQNASSTTPEQWMASILQRQAAAVLQTPGTLTYTPAPPNPSGATIEAPWASWQTGDCNPAAGSLTPLGVTSPAAAAAGALTGESDNTWLIIAGLIGAAASLVYLKNSANRRAS